MDVQHGEAVVVDVREAIGRAPVGEYHVVLATLIGLVVFFDGYDTFNASYVIHYVAGPWHLRPGQAGWLVSSGLVGFSLAALLQGQISDRFGRRAALLAALWVATLFSLATAVAARSFWSFCALRFLTGIGLGVLLPISIAYLNEVSPSRVRAQFATWGWCLGFSLGGVAASVVGVFLTPRFGWPALYYVASVSALLSIVCHVWLPESPQFLVLKGRPDAARSILARLDPAGAARYREAATTFILPESHAHGGSLARLLQARYRRRTVAASAAAFFVMFAIYGLTGWAPTAMMARGESFSTSFGFGAIILAMNFVGALACGAVMDRWRVGRAAPAAWWVMGGAAVAILSVAGGHTVNVAAMVLAGFGILGGQGALNNLVAGWYETEVRATALGVMLGLGRIGGILGPYLLGLVQEHFAVSAVFLVIGGAACLGAASLGVTSTSATANRGSR